MLSHDNSPTWINEQLNITYTLFAHVINLTILASQMSKFTSLSWIFHTVYDASLFEYLFVSPRKIKIFLPFFLLFTMFCFSWENDIIFKIFHSFPRLYVKFAVWIFICSLQNFPERRQLEPPKNLRRVWKALYEWIKNCWSFVNSCHY